MQIFKIMNRKIIFIFLFLIFPIIKSGIVKIFDENFKEKLIYENIDYLLAYKISNSIFNYTSNGGSNIYYNLSFAFDNDFNTYWESAKYQGEDDSFLNNIQITFLKTVTIDRMIYKPQTTRNIRGYGYPIELKIYFKLRNPDGTLSEDDSDFLLVDDIISERTEYKVLLFLPRNNL